MMQLQERTRERPSIQVLEANYLEDTDAIRKDSPAYLLAISERPTANGIRVRLYVRARDGRYIAIWQRRALVGKFRPVDVSPRNPVYDFLARNARVLDIPQEDA